MILTGKAKEDFYKFLTENYPISSNDAEKWFLALYDKFKNALIIEWFDSVGLWEDNFYYEYRSTGFKDYKKAILSTIKKANEIYNEM